MNTTDVFVIGGGPAGLAAAMAARQRGWNVVLADGARPPIDKACGEGLMPDGLEALERLGLTLPLAEAYPFRGIRFVTSSYETAAPFPGGARGLAVRRTVLHPFMVERAAQMGVELRWGTPVTGISGAGVHLGREFIRARWIIGADGSNSRVRRWAGLEKSWRPRMRYAFRQHYRVAPWTDHMEVHWGDRCQGYATSVGSDRVCVAIASNDPRMRVEDALRELPKLRARLDGAEVVSSERGAMTGNRRLKRVWSGNVALIGDASGTVDAITGEGLGMAFSQAVAVAECIASGTLAPYQAAHWKLSLRPVLMARLMLMLDQRPWLQRRTMQVFRKRPEIFERLLAMHVGVLPPSSQMVRDGVTLGWGLLTA